MNGEFWDFFGIVEACENQKGEQKDKACINIFSHGSYIY
jgi:hypothetical protein